MQPNGAVAARSFTQRQKILTALRAGCPRGVAYKIAGVTDRTLANWRAEDPTLNDDLDAAEAESKQILTGYVMRHAVKDWKAAAWMLERRWPAEFAAQKAEININAQIDVAVQQRVVEWRGQSPEVLARLALPELFGDIIEGEVIDGRED